MARKIVLTSGKGGVGKTSISASLGISLANRNNRCLIIDADVGLNNLDVVMGVENQLVYDMADVIAGKCTISNALIQDKYNAGLYILPSSHAFNDVQVSAAEFRSLIYRLEDSFDFILIDCPAGIDVGFHRAVSGADEAIVVTTPHISAIRDGDKVLSMLASYGLNAISVIVNRVRGDLVLQGNMMSAEDIAKVLRYPLIGVVPEDDNLTIYSQLGRIGLNAHQSRIAVDLIADNILSGKTRLYDPTLRYRGLIGKLKMWLEKSI